MTFLTGKGKEMGKWVEATGWYSTHCWVSTSSLSVGHWTRCKPLEASRQRESLTRNKFSPSPIGAGGRCTTVRWKDWCPFRGGNSVRWTSLRIPTTWVPHKQLVWNDVGERSIGLALKNCMFGMVKRTSVKGPIQWMQVYHGHLTGIAHPSPMELSERKNSEYCPAA